MAQGMPAKFNHKQENFLTCLSASAMDWVERKAAAAHNKRRIQVACGFYNQVGFCFSS